MYNYKSILPIVSSFSLLILAMINTDFIVDNQITAFVDGQYYNYLIRNYSLNELYFLSPNLQTLPFLILIYPLKYIDVKTFPFVSLAVILFLLYKKNNQGPNKYWAILPVVPYMLFPTKEFVILLVYILFDKNIYRFIFITLARPVMFVINYKMKFIFSFLLLPLLYLVFYDQAVSYENLNMSSQYTSLLKVENYGLLAVFFRLIVYWPLLYMKVIFLNFLDAPNYYSVSIVIANFLFVFRFNLRLLKIIFDNNYALISMITAGLFFFQMQRIGIFISVLFILHMDDYKKSVT